MAAANFSNEPKDTCQYFYINRNPLIFYPNGVRTDTKVGLLWRVCSEDTFSNLRGRIPRGLESSCQLFVCLDYPQTVAACLPSDMKRLTAVQKELLWPVHYSERLYCLEKSLQIGQTCHVGDWVLAADPSGRELSEPTKFIVRFKGNLRERRDKGCVGTYFGLVSAEPIKTHAPRQISCFASVCSPDVAQYAIRERNEGDHQAVLCHLEWIVGLVDKKFSLKSGDEVLWFDDERPSPLRGVVARIVSDKLASVNFSYDGKKKLMDVPIEALMLASDYEVQTADGPGECGETLPTVLNVTSAAADESRAVAASVHRRQQNSDGAAPPAYLPVDLAAEHGLTLNASILVDEPDQHAPQRGVLLWCGRFHDQPIACVDCEVQPFDTLSAVAVRRACPTASADRNVAFVRIARVRLDPRFRVTQPAGSQAAALPAGNSIGTCMSTEPADRLDPNFTTWEIVLKKNGKKKCIGEGGFGKVYKAFTDCHQTVAVKIVKLRCVRNISQFEKAVKREQQGIELLNAARHPNVMVFLKSEFAADNQFCIFMELIAGSSLAKLMLQQKKPFDEAGVKKFSFQICSALNFLHHRKPAILHRDINCNNIMLTNEGVIKLIDFGLAKELISATAYDTAHICGTQYFMAPELFNPDGNALYSVKSDVWAFGCTVFEMVEMEPPNANLRREQIPMAVLTRDMPQMKDIVSDSLRDFYNCCVVKDRKLRADTSKLLRHEFLKDCVSE